jgi:hypothetical protein
MYSISVISLLIGIASSFIFLRKKKLAVRIAVGFLIGTALAAAMMAAFIYGGDS